MSLRRAFELLVGLVGRIVAQIICFVGMIVLMGLAWRAFLWLDDQTSWRLDPVYLLLVLALSGIAFSAWRMLASANLDE